MSLTETDTEVIIALDFEGETISYIKVLQVLSPT